MKREAINKGLYFLVLIMGVYFIIRLIDQAKMIYLFPLVNNDLGSYVAQLHLLKVCGFHNFCPYWYNGFINFLISPPGWEFLTYPLYSLFSNILLAVYISVILMYTIGFIFIYYLGKSQKFSWIKITAFFVLIFANSISIGNFIITGRMPSLNATVFFLGLATIIYSYKNRKLDKWFVLFFTPINVLVILSHYQEAMLAQLLILSMFLIKRGYERLILLLSFLLSLLLSAFWWVPFLLASINSEQNNLMLDEQGKWFAYNIVSKFELSTQFFTSLLILITPIVLLILFYFYWASKNRSFKELMFYSPVLLLTVLFWLRITAYLPVFKNISPDPFLIFFLFFILVIFFKTDFDYYPKVVKLVLILFLIFIPVINVTVSHTKTPYWNIFEYGDIEKETLSLFKFIDQNEKFVFASSIQSTRSKTYPDYYYAYATVYNNLSTPGGYYYHITSRSYFEGIYGKIRKEEDCGVIKRIMMDYNTTYAIAYEERCDLLKNCNFKEVISQKYSCLYKL